jgi:hypothetical protein
MGPSAPPHRVSGGRGGAARHHLAAEPGLGKSPSGPIYSFPKFNAGLVYFSLRGPRETGARSYRVKLYPSDWSGGQRAEGGHNTVQLETWTLGGVPVAGAALVARVGSRGQQVELVDPGAGPKCQSIRKTRTRGT